MNRYHNILLKLILILIFLSQFLWAQNYSQLQKARQDLIENEKNRFINRYLYDHQQLQTNQSLFDITSYRLNLNLNPQSSLLSGQVTIHGISLSNNLSRIDIDLSANMAVDSIRQDMNALNFFRIQDLVTISLRHSLNSGEIFDLTISYHGNPEHSGFGAFGWDYHGNPAEPIIWTLSEPYGAPAWWPCKDDPADKADSIFTSITVPNGLTAVSNGNLKSVTQPDPAHTTFSWQTGYPISTYLVSLAISNYTDFHDWYVTTGNDSMPVDFYVYREHLVEAEEDLKITVDLITFYASVFGEYPFLNEKYGLAIFPWGGAMEHQTITSYGAGLITGNHFFDFINAHELAHQWFGDCITMRSWSHIWLNEGFASYAEALWEEHLHGKTAYFKYMKAQERTNFAGSLYIADTTDINALFGSTVYDKGSWVLHMLRGVLGDSLFFASLLTYANHPDLKYGTALTEDFQFICEQVSDQDLDWFFKEWVYRAGRPEYTATWYTIGEGPYNTRLMISQNNSDLYKMPLQIQLTANEMDTTITIWNDRKSQEYSLTSLNLPESLNFDPDGWVLKQVNIIYAGHYSMIMMELSSFTIQPLEGKNILNWTAISSLRINEWIIERRTTETEFSEIGRTKKDPNMTNLFQYKFVDLNVLGGELFTYRLKAQLVFDVFPIPDTVTVQSMSPQKTNLYQNYPNPFNTETHIMFSLPQPMKVSIRIYDIQGRLIKILLNNSFQETAFHHYIWDGTADLGPAVASGLYYIEFNSESFQKVIKAVLIK